MEFTRDQVWSCYQFAKKMIGNHNPNMIMEREDWEIFRDDFRGKLGEVALKNYITKKFPSVNFNRTIDFDVTPRGQWDISDLIVNNKNISVKSIRGMSNFLLIEKKRFTEDGKYSYKNNNEENINVDIYVLVKITITKEFEADDINYKSVTELKESKGGRIIKYEIMGGITHADFWKTKHFAPKGIRCNLHTLESICKGQKVKVLPKQTSDSKSKEYTLQQDNYILDGRNELMPIDKLLKKYILNEID